MDSQWIKGKAEVEPLSGRTHKHTRTHAHSTWGQQYGALVDAETNCACVCLCGCCKAPHQIQYDVMHNHDLCLPLTHLHYAQAHTCRSHLTHTGTTHIRPHTAYSRARSHRPIWPYSVGFHQLLIRQSSGVICLTG